MFEQRITELGLQLPPEPLLPSGVRIPFGRVPSEVPLEAAQESARLTVLAMLGALRLALGSLDRVRDWVTLSGFVNADPASDLARGVRRARQARANGDRGVGATAEPARDHVGRGDCHAVKPDSFAAVMATGIASRSRLWITAIALSVTC
jgi:hypothetical protein